MQFKISTAIKANQPSSLRILAKQKIRIQASIDRFEVQKANLSCLKIKLMEMSAMQVMATAIGKADEAMVSVMNCGDMKEMGKMVRNFASNMDKMNDRQENMAEMMDEVFEGDSEGVDIERLIDEEVASMVEAHRLQDAQRNGIVLPVQNMQK